MAADPDRSRWHVIYPVYINSKKTLAQGRKIPVSKAVEDPTVMEICDCLNYMRLVFYAEFMKAYPRDYLQRGRVRVQLRKEDGTPSNPAIATRQALYVKLAALIPKHQGRANKGAQQAAVPVEKAPVSDKKAKGGRKKK